MNEYIGNLSGNDMKIAIVVSRFNEFITKALLDGAISQLAQLSVQKSNIHVFWVPGALEIPLIAQKVAGSKKFDGIIALGAVIRGATSHYDVVVSESAKGLSQVGFNAGIPCVNGIITTDSIEQAIERAGTKAGNKGADAAKTVVEILNLISKI